MSWYCKELKYYSGWCIVKYKNKIFPRIKKMKLGIFKLKRR